MRILVRGGGDLASGAIARVHRAGWKVLVAELAQPLAVRRTVSFAQTVYSGQITIEEISAQRVTGINEINEAFAHHLVPVIVDPDARIRFDFGPEVIIDGRMRKAPPELALDAAPLILGLGPGFHAGVDCHAVIETVRGARLGRVYWDGKAQENTGIPERVLGYTAERVLRAPSSGILKPLCEIGEKCKQGDILAQVGSDVLRAPFDGVVRGMLQEGLAVRSGMKIGDIDPRGDPSMCWIISDKALSVGGGVLEAILTWLAKKKGN